MNYKTQNGLIKALTKANTMPMTVQLAWWFHSAEYALINLWGWSEKNAAVFIARYKPDESAYRATAGLYQNNRGIKES